MERELRVILDLLDVPAAPSVGPRRASAAAD
jgi:hypothetical protein